MARSLSQTLYRLSTKSSPSSLSLSFRTQSIHSPSSSSSLLHDLTNDPSESSDPLLRRLEDAIHRIIVRRSAPDWLPFLPGSSYWVPPPRSRSQGIAQFVEKLVDPLTEEESMSTTTLRGWPSSSYFLQGAPAHPVEGDAIVNIKTSEDEEG